jgi:hypothetical protein
MRFLIRSFQKYDTLLADPMSDSPKTPVPTSPAPSEQRDVLSHPELPSGMTLEGIIDLTGEMEHLNELVLLHLEQNGGFTSTSAYFAAVRPILDDLESEIRSRYEPVMTREDLKSCISIWIDTEISMLQ